MGQLLPILFTVIYLFIYSSLCIVSIKRKETLSSLKESSECTVMLISHFPPCLSAQSNPFLFCDIYFEYGSRICFNIWPQSDSVLSSKGESWA